MDERIYLMKQKQIRSETLFSLLIHKDVKHLGNEKIETDQLNLLSTLPLHSQTCNHIFLYIIYQFLLPFVSPRSLCELSEASFILAKISGRSPKVWRLYTRTYKALLVLRLKLCFKTWLLYRIKITIWLLILFRHKATSTGYFFRPSDMATVSLMRA